VTGRAAVRIAPVKSKQAIRLAARPETQLSPVFESHKSECDNILSFLN
jgi:hypothetical protein